MTQTASGAPINRTRVYCFPYAGGAASAFFELRKRCAALDLQPIEYPGRGSRWSEPQADTLQELVEKIVIELRPNLGTPYALLGHSFGALVAYKVARQLLALAVPPPARVFLSAARAPHLPLRRLMHTLPETEFLTRLMTYGGMPPEVLDNKELLSVSLPIVRNDFRIFEQSACEAVDPLPVPISALGGLLDREVPLADLLPWREHTTKAFRSRFYSSGHFFLYEPRFPVLDDIQTDLQASTTSTEPLRVGE